MTTRSISSYLPILGNSLSCGAAGHYFWGPKAGLYCAMTNATLSLCVDKPAEIRFWWRWEISVNNLIGFTIDLIKKTIVIAAKFAFLLLSQQNYRRFLGPDDFLFEKILHSLPSPQREIPFPVLLRDIVIQSCACNALMEGFVLQTVGRAFLEGCVNKLRHTPLEERISTLIRHLFHSASYLYVLDHSTAADPLLTWGSLIVKKVREKPQNTPPNTLKSAAQWAALNLPPTGNQNLAAYASFIIFSKTLLLLASRHLHSVP